MEYVPAYTEEEVLENKKIFSDRISMYKKKGLDFLKSREFILKKAALSKRKVLDIGTGRGISSIYLAEAGHMVMSIDIKEEMLRTAALNIAAKDLIRRVQLYKMDAYSMDFDKDNFGAVFMVEALHHVKDIDGLLTEIDRVLIPGGAIVLSDFNKRGMAIVDQVHEEEGHEHVNLNTGPGKVLQWLEENGYETERYDNKCHWLIVAVKG